MTDEDFDAMDDYLTGLEGHLRTLAVEPTPRRSVRRAVIRPRIVVPTTAIGAVLVAVLFGAFGGGTSTAYGRPAILDTPTIGVPTTLQRGLALRLELGPDARLDDARPIAALDGDGYLLSGEDAWCLSVPDRAKQGGARQPAVFCTRTAEFMRIGLRAIVRRRYVAVVPRGVPNPSVTNRAGQSRALQPDSQGVVVADLAAGDTVTRYGTDGGTRVDPVQ